MAINSLEGFVHIYKQGKYYDVWFIVCQPGVSEPRTSMMDLCMSPFNSNCFPYLPSPFPAFSLSFFLCVLSFYFHSSLCPLSLSLSGSVCPSFCPPLSPSPPLPLSLSLHLPLPLSHSFLCLEEGSIVRLVGLYDRLVARGGGGGRWVGGGRATPRPQLPIPKILFHPLA